MNLANASPIKFQIKRNLDLVSDDTKECTGRKLQQFMECAKKKFADCVAPGQSEKLLEMMEEGESSDDESQMILLELSKYTKTPMMKERNLLFFPFKIMTNTLENF